MHAFLFEKSNAWFYFRQVKIEEYPFIGKTLHIFNEGAVFEYNFHPVNEWLVTQRILLNTDANLPECIRIKAQADMLPLVLPTITCDHRTGIETVYMEGDLVVADPLVPVIRVPREERIAEIIQNKIDNMMVID
jgi:hypothetical protein